MVETGFETRRFEMLPGRISLLAQHISTDEAMMFDLAKSFGKGDGFAAGLILRGFIFFPILAFGSSQYQGPAAAPTE